MRVPVAVPVLVINCVTTVNFLARVDRLGRAVEVLLAIAIGIVVAANRVRLGWPRCCIPSLCIDIVP